MEAGGGAEAGVKRGIVGSGGGEGRSMGGWLSLQMFAGPFGDAYIPANVGWMTTIGSIERRGK